MWNTPKPASIWAEWAHRPTAVPVREPQTAPKGLRHQDGVGCPAGVWSAGLRKQASTNGVADAHGRALPFALHSPVDGRAGDAEQVGELRGAVLTAIEQGHQVRFLPMIQLGLLVAQSTFGLGDLH